MEFTAATSARSTPQKEPADLRKRTPGSTSPLASTKPTDGQTNFEEDAEVLSAHIDDEF